ncbi:GNAT family N-acetyltransferase [Methylocystis sp. ATCC 49242]|uniref:GNAT family N-acetyltransferase n=1 Tax=Methylocystis sp. ATCC 49242 TaxID=622637 RepID=UPI0001F875E2|nr:GNAT family N-acetyltransferase [Methylocystis sp. ATCC 49242]
MSKTPIRRAGIEDARTIAEIHVAAWRETYAQMMPAETLAGLDVDEWAARWRKSLAAGAGDPAWAVFLALDEEGAAAGFAKCERQTSEKMAPLGYEGEFSSIYLLRRMQRRGAGRRLMAAMAGHLLASGCKSASVWMFRDALHARRFYEALGATPTGVEGVWEIYGLVLPDVAYGWRDIRALAQS